jgi:hypothetical protein
MQTICSRCQTALSVKERGYGKLLCRRCESHWITEFRGRVAKYVAQMSAAKTGHPSVRQV